VLGLESVKDAEGKMIQEAPLPVWANFRQRALDVGITEITKKTDLKITIESSASKNSLTSWWVEDEIKTTLEKERALRKERGKPVHKLIPLNLDGYMFTDQWDLGVLANEIRSRVAADFQDWEKPNSNFSQKVDRVIKALRADEGARELPPPSKL